MKVYATQLDQGGELFGQQLATFAVGEGANIVRVAGKTHVNQRSGSELNDSFESKIQRLGEGLVYVTSITDGLVTVIDPIRLEVLSRIPVGRGAHDIAFMLSEAGELRAYVSLFEEHKLSVIDIQPGSETRFTVIGEIK